MTWILIAAFAALFAYVRLAPVDTGRWHVPITQTTDATFAGGAVRIVPATSDGLAKIDAAMHALPRTRQIAGTLADARVTYVTRSLVWGFPDFTTIEQTGDEIRIYARLRFGKADLGVNARRVDAVIAEAFGASMNR